MRIEPHFAHHDKSDGTIEINIDWQGYYLASWQLRTSIIEEAVSDDLLESANNHSETRRSAIRKSAPKMDSSKALPFRGSFNLSKPLHSLRRNLNEDVRTNRANTMINNVQAISQALGRRYTKTYIVQKGDM